MLYLCLEFPKDAYQYTVVSWNRRRPRIVAAQSEALKRNNRPRIVAPGSKCGSAHVFEWFLTPDGHHTSTRTVCVVRVVPTADSRSLYKFWERCTTHLKNHFSTRSWTHALLLFSWTTSIDGNSFTNIKQYELWESFQCYTYTNTRTDLVQYAHCQSSLPIDLIFPTFPIILADILYFTAVKMACYPMITLCHLDSLHAVTFKHAASVAILCLIMCAVKLPQAQVHFKKILCSMDKLHHLFLNAWSLKFYSIVSRL